MADFFQGFFGVAANKAFRKNYNAQALALSLGELFLRSQHFFKNFSRKAKLCSKQPINLRFNQAARYSAAIFHKVANALLSIKFVTFQKDSLLDLQSYF